MKIRSGFVSNSSSSSFLMYGVCIDESKLRELLEMDEADRYISDFMEEKLEGTGLDYKRPSRDYPCYIGVSWSNVGGEETGNQFKARVEEALRKLFGDKLEINARTMSEAWHD